MIMNRAKEAFGLVTATLAALGFSLLLGVAIWHAVHDGDYFYLGIWIASIVILVFHPIVRLAWKESRKL